MRALLILDGDNTLWDTNFVFKNAQLDALNVFENEGWIHSSVESLQVLRQVDQLILGKLNLAEYDFSILFRALGYMWLEKLSMQAGLAKSLEVLTGNPTGKVSSVAHRALSAFQQSLSAIPSLLPGVASTLTKLRREFGNGELVMLLHTEGDTLRIQRTITAMHAVLDGIFDATIIKPKDERSLSASIEAGRKFLSDGSMAQFDITVMVGDSLKRDIRPAHLAGMRTVYVPSAYKGREEPKGPEEIPDYTLDTIAKLPQVLELLGLHH